MKVNACCRLLSLLTVTAVLSLVITPVAWAKKDNDASGERQSWQRMSEQDRAEIRAGQQRFQKLSPAQKQKLLRARHQYQNLPEEEQRALREHWRDVSQKKDKRKNKN